MLGNVLKFLRTVVNGENVSEVEYDPGTEANETAQAAFPPGFDAVPLASDYVVTIDIGGGKVAIGFHDPAITPEAQPGEVLIFSRSAPGVIAGKFHMKASGSIFLNGVEITPGGEIKAPGEVSAMNATAPVKLSTHLHPTAMGPTSPPTPG